MKLKLRGDAIWKGLFRLVRYRTLWVAAVVPRDGRSAPTSTRSDVPLRSSYFDLLPRNDPLLLAYQENQKYLAVDGFRRVPGHAAASRRPCRSTHAGRPSSAPPRRSPRLSALIPSSSPSLPVRAEPGDPRAVRRAVAASDRTSWRRWKRTSRSCADRSAARRRAFRRTSTSLASTGTRARSSTTTVTDGFSFGGSDSADLSSLVDAERRRSRGHREACRASRA